MEGLYAFLLLAIIVWFALGMANPSISLPPTVMKFLEPNEPKPTRKIVFQWSCTFAVIVAIIFTITAVLLISDHKPVFQTARDVQSKQKSTALLDARIDLLNLVESLDNAVDNPKSDCKLLAESEYPQVKILVSRVIDVETNPASKETLVDINEKFQLFVMI